MRVRADCTGMPGDRMGWRATTVDRGGYSLVEVLTALVVSGVFLAGLASLLQGFAERSREVIRRVDEAQALRTVWVALEEELAAGRPGLDWQLDGARAIRLRAFRGLARVLGPAADPGRWEVAWIGHRDPQAGRDSLRVLSSEGAWVTVELRWVGAGPETVGGDPEGASAEPIPVGELGLAGARGATWEWAWEVPGEPVLARVFESGRYSLEDGAFRYRRGNGGRQPLTPELIGAGSGFAMVPGGLRVRVEFTTSARGVEWVFPGEP